MPLSRTDPSVPDVRSEEASALIGRVLGNYRLLKLLGRGGMGAVFLGEHQTIGHKAAIKVLHRDFAVKQDVVQRFFNEARAANLVKHPGIVEIFDLGQDAAVGAYIVMEYLEGENLGSRLRRLTTLSTVATTRVVSRVASALGAAHRRGLIHRDLKPDNIFLIPDADHPGDERVKVLDFGIAKLQDESAGAGVHTETGIVVGTPMYMSPEHCHGGRKIDHRTDVYALGILAYEMLSGVPPHRGAGYGEIFVKHITEKPASLLAANPRIPARLEAAVLRALAKDPDDRFQTMEDMAAAFLQAMPEVGGPASVQGKTTPAEIMANVTGAQASVGPLGIAPTVGTGGMPSSSAASAPAWPPRTGENSADVEFPVTTDHEAVAAGSRAMPAHAGGPSTLSASAVSLGVVPRARPKWLVPAAAAGALVVAASIVTVIAVLTSSGGDDANGRGARVTAAFGGRDDSSRKGTRAGADGAKTAAPDTAASTAAAPRPILLSITTEPPGAEVVGEPKGAVLGRTPWAKTYPAAPGSLAVLVRKKGFESVRLVLSTVSDAHQSLTLVPTPKAAKPKVPKTKAGKLSLPD